MITHSESLQLVSQLYTSKAAENISLADLQAIRDVAVMRNAMNGITGVLLFTGASFCQYLEGPEASIDELVDAITLDRRHSDINVNQKRLIEGRICPDWSMRVVHTAYDSISDDYLFQSLTAAKVNSTLAGDMMAAVRAA